MILNSIHSVRNFRGLKQLFLSHMKKVTKQINKNEVYSHIFLRTAVHDILCCCSNMFVIYI